MTPLLQAGHGISNSASSTALLIFFINSFEKSFNIFPFFPNQLYIYYTISMQKSKVKKGDNITKFKYKNIKGKRMKQLRKNEAERQVMKWKKQKKKLEL